MTDIKDVSELISIIYEDGELLIINKPAGITVNNSDTTGGEVTVQDWAGKRLGIVSAKVEDESDFYKRSGIVHRLDKETSGILLIAKDEASFMHLQNQFKERTVKKTYYALAHGKVAPMRGEIRVPVGRLPWNRRQFGVVAGGREALTEYQVTGYYVTPGKRREQVSLVELKPLTGRTHQIRVHLQYLGHPIFSDFLYAGRKTQREDRKLLTRVFLHGARISFLHPRTQTLVTYEAPLPRELQSVMDHLTRLQ